MFSVSWSSCWLLSVLKHRPSTPPRQTTATWSATAGCLATPGSAAWRATATVRPMATSSSTVQLGRVGVQRGTLAFRTATLIVNVPTVPQQLPPRHHLLRRQLLILGKPQQLLHILGKPPLLDILTQLQHTLGKPPLLDIPTQLHHILGKPPLPDIPTQLLLILGKPPLLDILGKPQLLPTRGKPLLLDIPTQLLHILGKPPLLDIPILLLHILGKLPLLDTLTQLPPLLVILGKPQLLLDILPQLLRILGKQLPQPSLQDCAPTGG